MSNIFSKKSIGIDIADHTVEAVELRKSGGKTRIVSLGRIELEPGIVERGRIKDEAKLSQAMIKVFNNALPNPIVDKNIIFGLPESQIFIHVFTIKDQFVKADNQECSIEELVLKEARTSIPLKEDETLFSYKILHQTKNETKILLIATRKKVALEWQRFFKKLKKNIEIFDIETLASRRSLLVKNAKEPICLVDIGAATANIAIFNKTGLRYAYAINNAGDTITKEIVKALKVKTDKAEAIKIKIGLSDTESLIFPAIVKVLEQILKEIQTALSYFKKNTGQSVKKIIFIGGSSKLKGLMDYFQTNFDLPVRFGQSELLAKKIPLEYIGAIGIALKGIDKKWLQKDPAFLASDIKEEKKPSKKSAKEEAELDIDNSEDSLLLQSDTKMKQNKKLRFRKITLGVILIVGLILIILAFWFR